MNSFSFIGRLTKEPETRYTKDNMEITTFTLAIDNINNTSFIKIITFSKLSQIIQKHCHKGDQIYINGMVKNNDYTDKDGNKHFEYVFVGNSVEFLSSKTNYIKNQESAEKVPKNVSKDDSFDKGFEEFAKKVEQEETDIAF